MTFEDKIQSIVHVIQPTATALSFIDGVNEWIKITSLIATLILWGFAIRGYWIKQRRALLDYKIREQEYFRMKAEELERHRPKNGL